MLVDLLSEFVASAAQCGERGTLFGKPGQFVVKMGVEVPDLEFGVVAVADWARVVGDDRPNRPQAFDKR